MSEREEPLEGGNLSVVVRVGETVRRPTGPWTPAVHALLDHLEAKGFPGSPRARGLDEQGREILTFLPGPNGMYQPQWIASDVIKFPDTPAL